MQCHKFWCDFYKKDDKVIVTLAIMLHIEADDSGEEFEEPGTKEVSKNPIFASMSMLE